MYLLVRLSFFLVVLVSKFLRFLPLSSFEIKTFSFACSCLSVTFPFFVCDFQFCVFFFVNEFYTFRDFFFVCTFQCCTEFFPLLSNLCVSFVHGCQMLRRMTILAHIKTINILNKSCDAVFLREKLSFSHSTMEGKERGRI